MGNGSQSDHAYYRLYSSPQSPIRWYRSRDLLRTGIPIKYLQPISGRESVQVLEEHVRELNSEHALESYQEFGLFGPHRNNCWQSAQVGQIRTREGYYYEELRGSSLRVLL